MEYYQEKFRPSNLKCPMCRREVRMIMAKFQKAEQNEDLYEMIMEYNHRNLSDWTYVSRLIIIHYISTSTILIDIMSAIVKLLL